MTSRFVNSPAKRELLLTVVISICLAEFLRRLLFRDGLSTQLFNGADFRCKLDACLALLERNGWQGDDRWMLLIASRISELQWPNSEELWILRIWSPGVGILIGLLDLVTFKLFGIYAIVAFVSGALWIAVILSTISLTPHFTRRVLIVLLYCVLFSTQSATDWMFGGAISYSESLSTGTFCLFLVQLFKHREKPLRGGLTCGLLLALCSYLRASFDIFTLGLSISILLIYGLSFLILQFSSLRSTNKPQSFHTNRWIQVLAIACVVAFFLALPWRIYRLTSLTVTPLFGGGSERVWANGWIPSSLYASAGNQWAVDVGINGLCQAYPQDCLEIAKKELAAGEARYSGNGYYSLLDFRQLTFQAIQENPKPWVQQRFSYLYDALRDALSGSALGNSAMTVIGLLFGYLTLSIARKKHELSLKKGYFVQVFVLLLVAATTIGPLFLASFETRYTYPFIYCLTTTISIGIAIIDGFTLDNFRTLASKLSRT